MDKKSKARDALKIFYREFGVPDILAFNGSKEQYCKGTIFMKHISYNEIKHYIIEPEFHNKNPVESMIRKKLPEMVEDDDL